MSRYELISYCGGGTYGRAYLLRYLADDSLRIAKVVDLTELSEACRQSALQEANLLLHFQHPHIVTCYEAFIHDNYFLVMIMVSTCTFSLHRSDFRSTAKAGIWQVA